MCNAPSKATDMAQEWTLRAMQNPLGPSKVNTAHEFVSGPDHVAAALEVELDSVHFHSQNMPEFGTALACGA